MQNGFMEAMIMDGTNALYSLIIGMACLTYGLRNGKGKTPVEAPKLESPKELPKLPPEIEELIKKATAVGESLINKVDSLEKEVKELKVIAKKTKAMVRRKTEPKPKPKSIIRCCYCGRLADVELWFCHWCKRELPGGRERNPWSE